MTAGCTLAVGGVAFAFAGALPAQAAVQPGDKVWVCKFVGSPGSERLSEGQNPSLVDWRSISKDPDSVTIGAYFGDNQERSYVIELGGDSPGRAACLAVIEPTPTDTGTQPTDDRTTTEPPVTTTTTEPPVTTTTTQPPATVPPTKTPTTQAPKPSGTPTPTRPHGPGKGHTPSVVSGLGTGAPHTGGSGQDTGRNPANTLVGGGLLFAALGLLSGNVLRGRKTGPDSAS